MSVKTTSIYRVMLPVVIVLAIPLIAMQFTKEVVWTAMDFMVMGILVFTMGLLLEVVRLQWRKKKFYAPLLILIGLTFFLLWAELAVGIFDSPIAGS